MLAAQCATDRVSTFPICFEERSFGERDEALDALTRAVVLEDDDETYAEQLLTTIEMSGP